MMILCHAHTIKLIVYLDMRSGKHLQLVSLSDLAVSLGEDYCATRLGLDVFSGEDCSSAFKGKERLGLLTQLEKNPRLHKSFIQHGEEWNLKSHVLKQLEQFTCLMHGQHRESSWTSSVPNTCLR